MPMILDAYNVVHTTGVLPPELAGTEIDHLIGLIESSRYRAEKITLACDGLPQLRAGESAKRQIGSITVRYAGKTKSADDLIAQLISVSTAPRSLIVVSSDHAVARHARRRRCKTMTSEEFLQTLADDALAQRSGSEATSARKPPSDMSAEQVQRWMSVFQVDEQAIAREAGVVDDRHADQQDDHQQGAQRAASGSKAQQAEPPVRDVPVIQRGPVVPRQVIEQAERLWQQQQRKDEPQDEPSD